MAKSKGVPKDNIQFVVTGHSRGGAVGNLLTKRLNNTFGTKDRVFNYNFAPTHVVRAVPSFPWQTPIDTETGYENVLNICNNMDPVTLFPNVGLITSESVSKRWGRYGRDIGFTEEGDKVIRLGAHRYEIYQREVIKGSPGAPPTFELQGSEPEPNMYELLGKQLLGSDTIGATIEASGFTIDQFLTICSIFDAELYGSDSKEEGLIDFFENVLTNQSLLNTFSRVYNSDYYIANNPDVVQLLNDDDPMLMLQHFLDVGMDEGKDSIANWNVNTYKESNADMEEAFGDDLRTYYVYYATEGFYETAQVD